MIRPDQTAYIPGRFIDRSIRLISDILEYTEVEQMEGYMFVADIEKAFDSVDQNFLIAVFKKFGPGHEYIQWVKALLYDQQSCVMNNSHSTGYFALNRGSRQGDPLSAFLFLLTIEVLFIMIRSDVNIKGLNIFENEIKLTACADDTTLFLRDLNPLYELLSLFQIFESWSSLKLNFDKSELCGIDVKKGVDLAFCGCKIVNLDKDTIKILGAHFSYNMLLVNSRNFVETIWSYRALTLIGRISVFKFLALSKTLYISSMKTFPKFITEKLDKLQKSFVWKRKSLKLSTAP